MQVELHWRCLDDQPTLLQFSGMSSSAWGLWNYNNWLWLRLSFWWFLLCKVWWGTLPPQRMRGWWCRCRVRGRRQCLIRMTQRWTLASRRSSLPSRSRSRCSAGTENQCTIVDPKDLEFHEEFLSVLYLDIARNFGAALRQTWMDSSFLNGVFVNIQKFYCSGTKSFLKMFWGNA